MVLPNPRGSTGFGQKFVDEISGDWGGKCYRDLVGLDSCRKTPYVDKDRIGAAGGSFGGYMMNWFAVSEIASRFKCDLATASGFRRACGARPMSVVRRIRARRPALEKTEVYAKFSPLKKAGNLRKYKTPMLLFTMISTFDAPLARATGWSRPPAAARALSVQAFPTKDTGS